jgi:hypothetical protein
MDHGPHNKRMDSSPLLGRQKAGRNIILHPFLSTPDGTTCHNLIVIVSHIMSGHSAWYCRKPNTMEPQSTLTFSLRGVSRSIFPWCKKRRTPTGDSDVGLTRRRFPPLNSSWREQKVSSLLHSVTKKNKLEIVTSSSFYLVQIFPSAQLPILKHPQYVCFPYDNKLKRQVLC